MKNSTNQQPNYVTGSFVDPRDNRQYQTVKIGGQTWMAENLDYALDVTQAANSDCEETDQNRLYTWQEAKNACPAGWRLPTKNDFQTLLNHVGAHLNSDNLADEGRQNLVRAGFDPKALGLIRYGELQEYGKFGAFWTSTEYSEDGTLEITTAKYLARQERAKEIAQKTDLAKKELTKKAIPTTKPEPAFACSLAISGNAAAIGFADKFLGLAIRCIKVEEKTA